MAVPSPSPALQDCRTSPLVPFPLPLLRFQQQPQGQAEGVSPAEEEEERGGKGGGEERSAQRFPLPL